MIRGLAGAPLAGLPTSSTRADTATLKKGTQMQNKTRKTN